MTFQIAIDQILTYQIAIDQIATNQIEIDQIAAIDHIETDQIPAFNITYMTLPNLTSYKVCSLISSWPSGTLNLRVPFHKCRLPLF